MFLLAQFLRQEALGAKRLAAGLGTLALPLGRAADASPLPGQQERLGSLPKNGGDSQNEGTGTSQKLRGSCGSPPIIAPRGLLQKQW